MAILELLGSAASGGLLGGVFSAVKLFGAYKEKKLQFAHELAMSQEDRKNMDKEIEVAKVKGTLDLEIEESRGDAMALTAAINAEATTKANSPWVQDFKSMTRPVLTYLLVIMAFGITLADQGNPWAEEIVFMASTAVTFWFGDRPRRLN